MFCTGLDFRKLVTTQGSSIVSPSQTDYITTLQRLSTNNMATISLIDGKVVAGGVGIAVASDIIIATPDSSFSLPKLLWGLIPACVLPYLIRRIGPQKASMLASPARPLARTNPISLAW